MKLLIISNMAHYVRNGRVVGWGPTVQEISHLSQLFEEVRHIACMYQEEAPQSALPYSSTTIRLIGVPPAGGDRLQNKFEILRWTPLYVRTILRELRSADVVHVRCPANISLLAILLLAIIKNPRIRWIKYAGNWNPDDREAWSYRFQRWWLRKRFHRALVTINGRWPNQPNHTRSFLNPCLTEDEIRDAETLAVGKELTAPIRLLFVGRIEQAKGVGRALRVVSRLQQENVPIKLELVGDGSDRLHFEKMAAALGCEHLVTFHGWVARPALAPIYSRSHILLFPTSSSEGWPKVLSEAMAYGVVPVAGSVSCISQFLEAFDTGRHFDPDDIQNFTEAIAWYALHVEEWKRQSNNGMKVASAFSYSNYLRAVKSLLSDQHQKQMPTPISGSRFARD